MSAAVLAVTSRLSVRDVLQTILASARRLLDARYAALGVPDDNGSFAEFLADGISDEQWRAIGPVPRQHGLLGVTAARPEPGTAGRHPRAPPVRLVAGRASGADRLPRHADHRRRRDPRRAVPGEQARAGRVHRAGPGVAAAARRARRDRAGQRPAVRAQPGTVHHGRTQPDRPRTARRRDAEAVQPAADRGRGGHPAGPGSRRGRPPSWTRCAGWPPRRPGSCGPSWSGCGRSTWPATAWTWRCANRPTCSTGCTTASVRFRGCPVAGLTSARQEAAYRIAQEALHNALRHGQSRLT